MIEGATCQCGKRVVPYRMICPSCGRGMDKTEYENYGTVLTYTTLYAPPEGFECPIGLAMVKLADGANLLCQIEGDIEMKIGEKVTVKRKGELFLCAIK